MQNSLTHTTNEAMKGWKPSLLWEDYLSKLDVTLDDMDSRGILTAGWFQSSVRASLKWPGWLRPCIWSKQIPVNLF